jgi:hypothetical protein
LILFFLFCNNKYFFGHVRAERQPFFSPKRLLWAKRCSVHEYVEEEEMI